MTALVSAADAAPIAPPALIGPLLVAAVATAAVGVATGRRDLVRGGIGLAAVQLATAALRRVAHRLDDVAIAPPPMVVDAAAVWLAERVVAAAMARFDAAAPAASP